MPEAAVAEEGAFLGLGVGTKATGMKGGRAE
jgi:hypothetical protein